MNRYRINGLVEFISVSIEFKELLTQYQSWQNNQTIYLKLKSDHPLTLDWICVKNFSLLYSLWPGQIGLRNVHFECWGPIWIAFQEFCIWLGSRCSSNARFSTTHHLHLQDDFLRSKKQKMRQNLDAFAGCIIYLMYLYCSPGSSRTHVFSVFSSMHWLIEERNMLVESHMANCQ